MSDIVRRLPANGEVRDRQQRFLAVSGELERQVWDLLLGPMSGRLRILQLGAVVEIMPSVYVQALRLDREEAPDRYIRLWYAMPTPDGGTEERTLLCFYTPGFPDPQYAQLRPGMDLNPAWWEAVRERLVALAAEQPEPWQLNESGAEPWELPPASRWQPAGQRPSSTGSPARTPPTSPASAPDAAPSSHQARVHLTLLQQNQFLFEEYKRLREEAYRERDTLERQLREAYFALYPFMRQAVQHATELDIGRTVARWAEQGCPPPVEAPAEQPVSGGQQAQQAQQAQTTTAEGPRPWDLALRLARAEARVRERRDTLEQLCELAGGHQPLPRRDPETGKLLTICERCDAQLYNRAPDIGDGWVR